MDAKYQQVLPFAAGDSVEARFSNGRWYRATVDNIAMDGSIIVEWEDGDRREMVKSCSEVRVAQKEPEYCWHVSLGKLFVALGIAAMDSVGVYLYSAGYDDIRRGLTKSGNWYTCSWQPTLTALAYLAPLCLCLRVVFSPALWKHLAEDRNLAGAFMSPPVLAWFVAFLVPFVPLVNMLLQPGFGDLNSAEATLANWPLDCAVDRPFHGLLQTRCWALLGAYCTEAGWHLALIMVGRNRKHRVWTLSIPCMMFTSFMLYHGPLRFLRSYSGAPCPDVWIEHAYVGCCILCFMAHTGLTFLCVHSAYDAAQPPFGPLMHWSFWVWILTLVVQVTVLQSILPKAQEIKAGPPWEACAVSYTEFFVPRHQGMIYFLYGQFASFPFTFIGCWLWR